MCIRDRLSAGSHLDQGSDGGPPNPRSLLANAAGQRGADQRRGSLRRQPRGLLLRRECGHAGPVSYTHLDVYKRQGFHRALRGYPGNSDSWCPKTDSCLVRDAVTSAVASLKRAPLLRPDGSEVPTRFPLLKLRRQRRQPGKIASPIPNRSLMPLCPGLLTSAHRQIPQGGGWNWRLG